MVIEKQVALVESFRSWSATQVCNSAIFADGVQTSSGISQMKVW